jgi:CheY-like chemotaxis protein/glycine cleavage system H lipoate-binding protein
MALSVKEALKLMDETTVDIVLTDLMMPEIDGLEFLQIMRERAPHIPVIVITGYATISTALQATKLGAFDYVAKPFTRSELLAVVDRAAQLVRAAKKRQTETTAASADSMSPEAAQSADVTIGEYGWKQLRDDGTIALGVERRFIEAVGRIQNIFLPAVGDELRQGSVYLRLFSSDLRSHTILSPLSGMVVEVNQKYLDHPETLTESSEPEWLVRLQPSKFEFEAGELGL